jgi:spore germination protein YaaH
MIKVMWYVVQPGDSLYLIARRFGISVEELKQANQLTSNVIYVGQRLYIPGTNQAITYVVQPGDSLYLIARKFNTLIESIMVLNNLPNTNLVVGQRLRIPLYTEVVVNVARANIRSGPGTNYEIITQMVKNARLPALAHWQNWYKVRLFDGTEGWISSGIVTLNVYGGDKPIVRILGFYTLEEGPTLPSSYNSFVNNTELLSEVGLFMFRIDENNPTQIEKFGEFTDKEVNTLVSIAHRNNIKIMPVVHNLLYKGGTTTGKNVVKQLVSTPENRRVFAQNLVRLIEKYDFDGVNIDIEDVYIEDSARLSALYTEIGNVLDRKGYFFSASVPSRVSDAPFNPFSDPFNYDAIGKAVDEFVVMLYNEHGWPGSPPGPPVSIGWMERVLNYTITKMPKEKVIAAVSVFGFDFNLTTGKNTYVTYPMAMDLARRYNKQITFDEKTQTPMFAYEDEQGNKHEVWFENRQSILAKIRLAWRLGISGIALWRLGMEDPAIWTMLDRDVVVRKV